MRTAYLKNFFCQAFTIFMVSVMLCINANGDVVGITGVDVSPPAPTITSEIVVTGSTFAGYYTISYLGSDFTRSGANIELDYYFYDSFPGGNRVQLAGGTWSDDALIGQLPQGTYSVQAKAWIDDYTTPGWIHYGNPMLLYWDDPGLSYRLAEQYNTSFVVTPEPTTITILGLGGLICFLRRKV